MQGSIATTSHEVQNNAVVHTDGSEKPQPMAELVLTAWREFWASPVNRATTLLVVGGCGYACSVILEL